MTDPSRTLLSVRAALVLFMAVAVALGTGAVSYTTTKSLPKSVLVALPVLGGAITLLNAMIAADSA